MKLSEDKEISFQAPVGRLGNEECKKPENFKLVEVLYCQPPKLKLVFSCDNKKENNRTGYIEARNNSGIGISYLLSYKKELEDKLIEHTWSEILEWDFRFQNASRS